MVKTFFYGILVGLIIGGIGWFSLGRIDTSHLQSAVSKTNKDLERVKSDLSDFGTKFDEYTGTMAGLTQRSTGLWEQAESLRERSSSHVKQFESIQSGILHISNEINGVEKSVRRSVVVSRDFADVLYEYRRRGKIDAKEK